MRRAGDSRSWFVSREKLVKRFLVCCDEESSYPHAAGGIYDWNPNLGLSQPGKTRPDGGSVHPGGRPLDADRITRRAGGRDC